jgi:3-oxoacyl-[acyl-carrier protein] reductase
MADRRVALVNDATFYVGPALAVEFARRGHDLVLGHASPTVVEACQGLGATVVAVPTSGNLADPEVAPQLVAACLERFGRIDAAVGYSGAIVPGRFLKSTVEDLRTIVVGCLEGPYHFLKAVAEPMVAARAGQIVLITSAAGARPTPGAALYSSVRAAATMMARNLAMDVAYRGVQVNAVGTNFMDFPEFHAANGTTDPEKRAKLEEMVPMKRMGSLEEFASFVMAFADGSSQFTTGQFVAYAGGWV